jgi:5-amino-6-(5-phosphoribosylamino)uracil reductase
MAGVSTTVVMALSIDGKISSVDPAAPRVTSPADQFHVEYQASLADLLLQGAGTIRAEGRGMTIHNPELLAARAVRRQSQQPIVCVVSQSLALSPDLPFFQQDLDRWILTTRLGLERNPYPELHRVARLIDVGETEIDWDLAYAYLEQQGIHKVVALGGGHLTASLLKARRVDDCWLTIWPLIYGGKNTPTPVEGEGFDPHQIPPVELIESRQIGSELFLHYRVITPA